MDETPEVPSYDDAQKLRLTDWVLNTFYEGWRSTIPISQLLTEGFEALREIEEHHRSVIPCDWGWSNWPLWERAAEGLLEHLAGLGIPGCFPSDSSKTVREYARMVFGEEAVLNLDNLRAMPKENGQRAFCEYFGVYGPFTKRLVRFDIGNHFKDLLLEAIKHPPSPPPPAPTPAPMKTDPSSPQGKLF